MDLSVPSGSRIRTSFPRGASRRVPSTTVSPPISVSTISFKRSRGAVENGRGDGDTVEEARNVPEKVLRVEVHVSARWAIVRDAIRETITIEAESILNRDPMGVCGGQLRKLTKRK